MAIPDRLGTGARGARRIAFRTAALLLFTPAASSGQENTRAEPVPAAIRDLDGAPRPSALAARATGRMEIDGHLDEAAWSAAPVIDRFIQQKPAAGMPATERTEVRILYDDRNLYIGAELFDSEPASLVIPTLQRDPNTRDGDAFGISLDTFLDRKSAFAFVINPGGAVRDLQSFDDGRINNAAWEAAYRLKTRIHENGWTVEFAIPWSTLRFDARRDEQIWGLNLLRRVRRKNEDATWAPMDRQWQIYVMSRAGMLRGLNGIQPGRNLSVKPFVLTDHASGELRTAASTGFDAGGDLKYGITPGLTLDLTVNTDFSQVEVDQQQVNLTRFSLFFPEKREFFLENSGLFEFGDQGNYSQRAGVSNRDFTLFHSRRIGLTPGGAPLPIVTGGRVSGTAGPVSIGVLNMQTRARNESQPENFTVARLRAEAAPGLTAGGIFINRSATSGAAVDNRSYGADLNYQAFKDYLLVQSYVAATEGSRIDGTPLDRSFAGRVSATWRDPFWEIMAMYRQFDPDFDPGVGFVRRTGIRHGYGTIGIRQRTAGGFLQELNPYIEMHRYTDFDGVLETREAGGGLDVEFGDGATASIGITDRFERVLEPFTIGNASVPAGTYDFTEASATYDASRARALSGRVSVSGGGYFGGDRYTVSGSVLGRLGYRALLDISAQHNRIDLPGQPPTTADVYGARLNAFFSTRVLTSAFVQYNQASHHLVTNVRLNWIHAPLSDLYVVLTERRDTEGDRVLERLVSVKVTRLLSF